MYGSWFRPFWSSGWNWFDFVIVLISMMALTMSGLPGIAILRLFRAFRVFRLFKRIESLLRLSVTVCPPRFKHVLFVHEPRKGDNVDIEGVDQHHALNLRAAPFWLNTTTVFEYGRGRRLKTVELFDVAEHCARVGPGTRRSLMPHVAARDVHLTVSRPQVVSFSAHL